MFYYMHYVAWEDSSGQTQLKVNHLQLHLRLHSKPGRIKKNKDIYRYGVVCVLPSVNRMIKGTLANFSLSGGK